ncbi:MAG: TatD family hydrolase [Bacteroidaceae bacterium]|nr:TatD family hydrolase [Bacteroidaceae bacterium]
MIYDIHTHHHPKEAGTAIVQLTPNDFAPRPGHYYSVGLHPWDITGNWEVQLGKLAVMALHPQVVMIGETGIDKKNGSASIALQTEVLHEQVRLSELVHKPLIIHCVKAVDELLAIRKETKATLPWVLHGFRGGTKQYEQLKRAGIYVSVGEHYNEEFVKEVPLTDILLESDESYGIDTIYELVNNDMAMDETDLRQRVWLNIRHILGWEPTPPF